MSTFDPAQFTVTSAKPLPVILLLDTSSSMSGGKIASLNRAVQEMLTTFSKEGSQDLSIAVAVVTFGGLAALHTPLTAAARVQWLDLNADGNTPMGEAIAIAKELIEDKGKIPSRAYRPTVVLVSDGQPNDDWQQPLRSFIEEGRSAKCDRMAMAIGSDADESFLNRFIQGTPHPLYKAANATQIHEFFRRVTMSVTQRANSKSPNEIPEPMTPAPSKKEIDRQPSAAPASPAVPKDSNVRLDGPSRKTGAAGDSADQAEEDGYW